MLRCVGRGVKLGSESLSGGARGISENQGMLKVSKKNVMPEFFAAPQFAEKHIQTVVDSILDNLLHVLWVVLGEGSGWDLRVLPAAPTAATGNLGTWTSGNLESNINPTNMSSQNRNPCRPTYQQGVD